MLGHWFISLFQTGEAPPPVLASLGAWGGSLKNENKPEKKQETISEPLPDPVIARIKDELLSASLAAEVIERARKQAQRRKNQQLAILLTL